MDIIISIDDGSQQQKLSWIDPDTGELQKLVVPNSLRKNWKSAALRSDAKVFNFTIDGRKYTHDITSHECCNTSHIEYQFSDQNIVSIHYALLQTGIDPERFPNVKLIATLPITQYYRRDDLQRNDENVTRKRNNLMRPVELNGGKTFNVVEVDVLPESIPACMSYLLDPSIAINEFHRTLVLDLGGVTLDMGVVRARFEDITSVGGNSDLGVSWVTKAAHNALAEADSDVSWHVANQLIIHRNDREFVEQVVNDHSKIDQILEKIEQRIDELGVAVAQEAKRFCPSANRVMLVGGGSVLIHDAIKAAYPSLGDKVMVIPGYESVLAVEVMKLNAREAQALMAS